MKCPNCGYIHGYNDDTQERVVGDKGKFYELPNSASAYRKELDWATIRAEVKSVNGCPSCGILFINVS